MPASNELNDLVNLGKEDIRRFVRDFLYRPAGSGIQGDKPVAMTVSSLLALSLKNTPPEIDVRYIRKLIIEENLTLLGAVADNDPRIIRLFALATGRVTQVREYVAAIERVGQTYPEDADAINRCLFGLREALLTVERVSVKIFHNEEGKMVLPDLANTVEPVDCLPEMG